MRGVYTATRGAALCGLGSSPHARGLPVESAHSATDGRIIPARAGFTPVLFGAGPRRKDHPRTRGVYTNSGVVIGDGEGSSPHARGLRRPGLTWKAVAGIIPAHAGFTRDQQPAGRGARDHPRTRGVYSPIWSAISEIWDHPRTRGVYGSPAGAQGISQGSSPHTRGLPIAGDPVGTNLGIIPAHAGFTKTDRNVSQKFLDHPRTRGVYRSAVSSCCSAAGSSPHTRGLLSAGILVVTAIRIIPAHAGFTAGVSGSGRGRPDHPRTRGVYSPSSSRCMRTSGSSPHTRGLPDTCQRVGPGQRIIPAHAGFT